MSSQSNASADLITPELAAARAGERLAYITGLREVADFLAAHPELPTTRHEQHLVCLQTREELVAVARIPGVRWRKDWQSEEFFSLKADFPGGHTYEVFVRREHVCRKVVTGTAVQPAQPEQTVELFRWECDEPLLAPSVAP
jgi:hypothetical protein